MVWQNKQNDRGVKGEEVTRNNEWLGDEPQVSVGGLLEQESNFLEATQFEDKSQDLQWGCGANRAWRGYHSIKTEDQKGLGPIL